MNGRMIALAAGGLLLTASPRTGQTDEGTKEAKVRCQGINECKGKGSCASASNDCSGHNRCKGKGWIETTARDCTAKKGTVLADKKQDDSPKAPSPPKSTQ